jgi:bacillolysin
MKKHYYLLFCIFLSSSFLFAQKVQKSISDFQIETQAKVTINENYGIAEFIRFPSNKAFKIEGVTLFDKAINFLELNKDIFKLDPSINRFIIKKEETDNYGLKHILVEQEFNGVPLYDGKLHFHFNRVNELTSVNGNYIPNIKISSIPSLSNTDANTIALQTIEAQNLNFSNTPLLVNKSTLYIFPKGLAQGVLEANYLVYEVEVRNNNDVREYVFVNAHNGNIVEQFTGMPHAMDRIVYESNTSNTVWLEGDAFPGTLTIWQQNEVVASEDMYNFFNNAFGYVSYDGADAQMRTINNNPNISCPNASWNGVTANYCDGTASDDVIGHEWGHAYTEYTSGLIYQWQSGAMNESFSDIWGETIDLLNGYEDGDDDDSLRVSCGSSDRWMQGEDASAFGGAIRDMWDPTCGGDPGKVTDSEYWCSTGDSGGVHINSGIPNHAYVLLVDGGTYNGQTINALGFTKAAHIFWRAQSQYLTATSDFSDLADALEASAADLVGLDLEGLSTGASVGPSGEMITNADLLDVAAVILAVELRINPDACGFTPLLSPIADLCAASASNPVFFEDWESGTDGWTVEQLPTNPGTWLSRDWVVSNNLPVGRTGNGVFGADPIIGDCNTDLENGILRLESPLITMPNFSDGNFEMAFNHYIATEALWDGGNIKIQVDGGSWFVVPSFAFIENPYNATLNNAASGNDNPMQGQLAFSGTDEGANMSSWGTSVINLSTFGIGVGANSTVKFRFEMGTDGCNGNDGWYIDEIMVYNCQNSLSLSDFQLNNAVKVYPNPSSDIFNIEKINNVNLIKAEVYDINGRFIKSVDLANMNTTKAIDLSQAASGIYFMTITSNKAKGVIKLIKQ